MDIQEIRQKYPMYADVPDAQLAKGFYDKFYSDMPWDQFAKKIGVTADKSAQIPGAVEQPKPSTKESSLLDKFVGGLDAAATLGTGAIGGIAGQIAGVGRTLTGGKFGTQEGIQQGQETARNVSEAMTWRPRTEEGQTNLQNLSDVIGESKIAGMPPAQGLSLAAIAPQVSRQATQTGGRVVAAGQNALNDLRASKQPQMVGMGSAMTDAERLRIERARSIPRPNELTKGQASRDFAQQQFESETAKNNAVGGPIRERKAQQNENILGSLDDFGDQTGAAVTELRPVGKIVTEAVVKKAQKAKGEINAAYEKARTAGETAEPVNVAPLAKYVADHEAEAINAPIIKSVEVKLGQIAKKNEFGQAQVSINDLEEVRKMVNALSGKDATNAHFGKELKGVIDQLTENVGGAEYQRARALRSRYAKEFENVGVIDKMMRTKPGTTDRAVAYEDIYRHSIIDGSLDDVRAVRRTLQTAGPEGEQAWKELQGATIRDLKEKVTKSATKDIRGNEIVNPKPIKDFVDNLDRDGKLDFIFTKKGAQQLRDLRDHVIDVATSPPGSVNYSNTASAIINALNGVAKMTSKIPGAHYVTEKAAEFAQNRQLAGKVRASLNPEIAAGRQSISLKDLAELSKGKKP